jgi:ketosteroid isomerase-like protein
MYHTVVRHKIRKLFEAVSRGDAEPVLQSFAPRFEHAFLGEGHALSGSRHSLAATRQWYERLYRLLPDIKFELKTINVSGTPWNTIASIEWRESNSGTDGVRTYNNGVHVARLCWGRVTQLIICPDTVGLIATLDRLALAGNAEAKAAPIVD